jgi:hypothetical protein
LPRNIEFLLFLEWADTESLGTGTIYGSFYRSRLTDERNEASVRMSIEEVKPKYLQKTTEVSLRPPYVPRELTWD